MSSNPPQLATMRADVDAILRPLLPARWKRVPHIADVPATFRLPILITEFTGINIGSGDGKAPTGWVWAETDLCIVIPTTADGKGEDEADAAVAALIVALDAPDAPIQWDTAKKDRAPTGQLYWRVSLSVMTETNPTT